jgi:predicted ester cyclase
MSNTTENKAIAQRFLELVNEHKIAELCDIISPDWRMHGGPPNLSPGADGIRELFATFGTIQQKWTIEDMIAESDKVAVRATNTCLQESFLGIPAHGQPQTFTAMFIHRIVNGKVVETWRNADDLGRLLQLGASLTSKSGDCTRSLDSHRRIKCGASVPMSPTNGISTKWW